MANRKRFNLEFVFRASPNILYSFLISPSNLAQWFADNVNEFEGEYTFTWGDDEEKATLLESEENSFVKFKWKHNPDNETMEFHIDQSELTGDTILEIFDYCEEYDVDNQEMLWESHIDELKTRIGG